MQIIDNSGENHFIDVDERSISFSDLEDNRPILIPLNDDDNDIKVVAEEPLIITRS